jgi:hypothetical protein
VSAGELVLTMYFFFSNRAGTPALLMGIVMEAHMGTCLSYIDYHSDVLCQKVAEDGTHRSAR